MTHYRNPHPEDDPFPWVSLMLTAMAATAIWTYLLTVWF